MINNLYWKQDFFFSKIYSPKNVCMMNNTNVHFVQKSTHQNKISKNKKLSLGMNEPGAPLVVNSDEGQKCGEKWGRFK